jgi:uncharacterized protein YndB with AHSA1/START domain
MAPITSSIDIARSPEDVYAYLDDLARHGEWQAAIESVTVETDGPVRVGTRARERRRVPGGPQEFTYEVTEHDPPHRFAFRVVDGPIRPVGKVTVSPLQEGSGSRVSIELEFKGHGFGKLLLPLARRDAAKTVPRDQQRLKERLESSAPEPGAGPG